MFVKCTMSACPTNTIFDLKKLNESKANYEYLAR